MMPTNRAAVKFFGLFLMPAVLSCCSETESKYRDILHLERPPEITAGPREQGLPKEADPVVTMLSIQQGLGDKIALDKSNRTKLIIKDTFEQSWFILDLVLNQQRIEITDKDRDAGYFYVSYDPGRDESKGFLAWLFRDSDYTERTYSLQLSEGQSATEITAAIVTEREDKPISVEGAPEPLEDIKKDGPERLLRMLYKTLRDGIPKHQQQ